MFAIGLLVVLCIDACSCCASARGSRANDVEKTKKHFGTMTIFSAVCAGLYTICTILLGCINSITSERNRLRHSQIYCFVSFLQLVISVVALVWYIMQKRKMEKPKGQVERGVGNIHKVEDDEQEVLLSLSAGTRNNNINNKQNQLMVTTTQQQYNLSLPQTQQQAAQQLNVDVVHGIPASDQVQVQPQLQRQPQVQQHQDQDQGQPIQAYFSQPQPQEPEPTATSSDQNQMTTQDQNQIQNRNPNVDISIEIQGQGAESNPNSNSNIANSNANPANSNIANSNLANSDIIANSSSNSTSNSNSRLAQMMLQQNAAQNTRELMTKSKFIYDFEEVECCSFSKLPAPQGEIEEMSYANNFYFGSRRTWPTEDPMGRDQPEGIAKQFITATRQRDNDRQAQGAQAYLTAQGISMTDVIGECLLRLMFQAYLASGGEANSSSVGNLGDATALNGMESLKDCLFYCPGGKYGYGRTIFGIIQQDKAVLEFFRQILIWCGASPKVAPAQKQVCAQIYLQCFGFAIPAQG